MCDSGVLLSHPRQTNRIKRESRNIDQAYYLQQKQPTKTTNRLRHKRAGRVRGGDIRTSDDVPARPLVLRNRYNQRRLQVSVPDLAPDPYLEQMLNNSGIEINS